MMDERFIKNSEQDKKMKELQEWEVEDMEMIEVPLDMEKDKDFIEKWGIEYDIDPEADLDEEGNLKEE